MQIKELKFAGISCA